MSITSQELSDQVVDRIKDMQEHPEKYAGWHTGIVDFDNLTGGVLRGRVYAIEAEAGMGKSAWLLSVVSSAGKDARVLNCSLEMLNYEVGVRMFTITTSGLENNLFRDNTFEEHHWPLLMQAHGSLSSLNAHWADDLFYWTDIEEEAKRLGEIDLIVVDYWQLAGLDRKTKFRDRTSELEEISRRMKIFALREEYPCSIWVAAQLNTEGRSFRSTALYRDFDLVITMTDVDDTVKQLTPDLKKIKVRKSRISETAATFLVHFNGARSLVASSTVELRKVDLNKKVDEYFARKDDIPF